jgi:hypothetical protein
MRMVLTQKTNMGIQASSPVVASAIHTDLSEAYNRVIRIKEEADIIIPLHAPEFLMKSRIPKSKCSV